MQQNKPFQKSTTKHFEKKSTYLLFSLFRRIKTFHQTYGNQSIA